MSFFRDYQNYKDEIDIALIQNGGVEIELYSVIASIIRESNNGRYLSVRDVSNRRKTEISKAYYGEAGFPDFVLLNREKDPNKPVTIYGCVEAKMPTIELNEKDEQIQGHIKSFKKVLYTNGIRWILFDEGEISFDITLGEIIKDNKGNEIKWYEQEKWNELLDKIDHIEWFKPT